jgi:PAT family beta-lactamase induction signal transducer AmpG
MVGCWVWHYRYLPEGEPTHLHGKGLRYAFGSLGKIWADFFRKDKIWPMLIFCFFYRFGEGFIERFGPLFLIDSRDVGGLGLSNSAVGNIYGSLGTVGFLAGALIGSWFVARSTLKRTLIWLALALNVPHLTYYLLSILMPHDYTTICVLVILEKFGFGVGSVGLILYMMQQVAPGDFKMSHYAFATGVMAGSKWATGTISGFVYGLMGQNYSHFFLFVIAASIPPVLLAFFAPFPHTAKPKSPGADANPAAPSGP